MNPTTTLTNNNSNNNGNGIDSSGGNASSGASVSGVGANASSGGANASSGGANASSGGVGASGSAASLVWKSVQQLFSVIPDFFVSTIEGDAMFTGQLLALPVWADPKTLTMLPSEGAADRLKYTKFLLFDSNDRHDRASDLQHLACGTPIDRSGQNFRFAMVKIYRRMTEAQLVLTLVSKAEKHGAFRGKPIKFNHVAGTLLKDRSGKVTIHAGDEECSVVAVAVLGAGCKMTTSVKGADGKPRTVSVSARAIVFLDPEMLREPISFALETKGALGIVLVMRYVAEKWMRGEVQERIDLAESKKRQQVSAQNAKLLEQVKAANDAVVKEDEDVAVEWVMNEGIVAATNTNGKNVAASTKGIVAATNGKDVAATTSKGIVATTTGTTKGIVAATTTKGIVVAAATIGIVAATTTTKGIVAATSTNGKDVAAATKGIVAATTTGIVAATKGVDTAATKGVIDNVDDEGDDDDTEGAAAANGIVGQNSEGDRNSVSIAFKFKKRKHLETTNATPFVKKR